VNRLRELCRWHDPKPGRCARSGRLGQRSERTLEQVVRRQAVDVSCWIEERGWTQAAAADFLRVAPRTLRHWQHDLLLRSPHIALLGRPALRSSRDQRQDVIALLDERGPALGLATLQACFPDCARAELADLLGRYRRIWRLRNRRPLRVLHWTVPGSVWAIDFTGPLPPIDGRYPYLLAVRDLASGQQLLWQPVVTATAETVLGALAPLFVVQGAPLVLKSDNGSPFAADAVQALLQNVGVIPLFSPPGLPQYNGAIEAAIGSLKMRTQDLAARHGRVNWTYEDVVGARLETNATARPHGSDGRTPDEAWSERALLGGAARARFQAAVASQRAQARADQGQTICGPLTDQQERAVDRVAIRRALEKHGYLLYSRRVIPLPIRKQKVANIM
jgi:transposase InsO family protein